MTDLATAPSALDHRRPRPRRYLMTPPDHFAVSYAINPWMHPAVATDTDLAVRQWHELRRTLSESRSPGRNRRPGAGSARHGLRRQRRPDHRQAHHRGAFLLSAARRRVRGVRRLAGGPRTRPRAPTATRQRGRGRFPGRRRPDPGRHGFSHHTGRAPRGGCDHRNAGRFARVGRPALLPPGHRARGAGRPHGGLLPGCLLGYRSGHPGRPLPRRRASQPRPTPRCSA